MATYTSYLNLEKPAVGETFNLLKINQNWDKIDQGVSALNSNLTSYVDYVQVDYSSNSFYIYWKVGRIVCLEVNYNVLDGTIPAWSAKKIGTLPTGFRPKTGYTKARLISDREASDAVMVNVDGSGDIRLITKYKPFEASGSIVSGTIIFPTTE